MDGQQGGGKRSGTGERVKDLCARALGHAYTLTHTHTHTHLSRRYTTSWAFVHHLSSVPPPSEFLTLPHDEPTQLILKPGKLVGLKEQEKEREKGVEGGGEVHNNLGSPHHGNIHGKCELSKDWELEVINHQ